MIGFLGWFGTDAARAQYQVELVAGGLDKPLYATHAPGDPDALYIVQQRDGGFGSPLTEGTIVRFDLDSGASTDFLTLTGLDTDTQGGAHSLAFHPDYQPGVPGSKLYVVALEPTTTPGISTSHLQEWVLDGSGDPMFNRTILKVPGKQPFDATHAMNWIGFRPGAQGDERDYLYVTMGDGGVQSTAPGYVNDPQNLDALYGKVLRLDVGGADDRPGDDDRNYGFTPTVYDGDNDGSDGVPGVTAPEVFYSGLRNPWRMSFDRDTSDIYIGDVGFAAWEEINYVPGGVIGFDAQGDPASPGDGAANGIDFGWARREGFNLAPGPNAGNIDPDGGGIRPDSRQPEAVFGHSGVPADQTMFSITGGYAYRGPQEHPLIQGKYFFGSFIFHNTYVGSFDQNGDFQWDIITDDLNDSLVGTGFDIDQIVSFAEDSDGNLYLIDFGDPCQNDCSDESGWQDVKTQFGTGQIYKISFAGVVGDFDLDGDVDLDDYDIISGNMYTSGAEYGDGDANGDGLVNFEDFVIFALHFGDVAGETVGQVPEPGTMALVVFGLACLPFGRRSARRRSAQDRT